MIFKALFESGLEGQKLTMLCKLVSLGVGLQNKPLLDAVAAWMQVCVLCEFPLLLNVHMDLPSNSVDSCLAQPLSNKISILNEA